MITPGSTPSLVYLVGLILSEAINFLMVMGICNAGSSITSESLKLAKVISNIPMHNLDTSFQLQVQRFMIRSYGQPPSVSVWGFISFNNSLLLSMMAVSATYLVHTIRQLLSISNSKSIKQGVHIAQFTSVYTGSSALMASYLPSFRSKSVGSISFTISEPLKRLRNGSQTKKQFSFSTETPDEDDPKDVVALASVKEEALSNFIVQRTIFSLLDPSDLRNCMKVSKSWEAVAAPLLNDIYVESRRCNLDCCKMTALITSGNSNSTLYHKVTWSDIIKYLEDSSCQTSYLHLSIGRVKLAYEEFFMMLPKFGPLISRLDLLSSQHLGIRSNSAYIEFIHMYFPNLKYLKLIGGFAFSDSADDEEDSSFASLETIDFGLSSKLSAPFVRRLLKSSPTLQSAFNFPVDLIDCMVLSRKYGTLRSVTLPGMQKTTAKTMEVLLGKLASLAPKLEIFNLEIISYSKFMSVPVVKAAVIKIIESSKDSLKRLVIARAEKESGHWECPILSVVEHLRFEEFNGIEPFRGVPFFPEGSDLGGLFPNVKTVSVNIPMDTQEDVNGYFPQDSFQTFGCRVRNLITACVNPECIQILSSLFPYITSLDILWSTQMPSVLGQVYGSCGSLRVLTLTVDHFAAFSKHGRHHNFDAAVTGLSAETCNDLRTNQKIMRENPGLLLNLKDLEKLRVIITDRKISVRGKSQSFITSVTIDYLMCFMPYLKMFIGIHKDCIRMKDLLELIGPILPHVECDACYNGGDRRVKL
ncbi:unnamed protein product [Allacma fusca]|uniref:F-box domain-containing protein n=1 Tax=Allacma fusca TaxID=39272 RepID=A0A8J2NMU4_9HEXA|nr:unnamed protein product [Allacma fusca]